MLSSLTTYQVLIGATRADGWATFHQSHTCDSVQTARDLVLDHPAAVAEQWRIITVTEVATLAVAA